MAFPRRTLGALALALGAWSCGVVLPVEPDAGLLNVPPSYTLARPTPGHQQHLALTGDKRVACHDCHALADAGFKSPGVGVCVTCHEAQQRQHHPFDAGVELSCFTCHPFKAESAAQRFEKWSCFTCHAKPQADAPAITVHKAECQACHRPHEEAFTQAADCTGCHEVKLSHGAKGDTLADTCMKCHAHHTPAVQASTRCAECHGKPDMPARARVARGALFAPGHPGCGTCHVAHTFDKDAVRRCEGCHKEHPVMGLEAHDKCVDCHRPHQPRAAPVTCESCHEKTKVEHPKDEQGRTCTGCHVVHGKQSAERLVEPCVACHTKPEVNAAEVHAASVGCADCHRSHGGKLKREGLCETCHEAVLKAVKKNKGHAKCAECHAGLPHAEQMPLKPCAKCHEEQPMVQQGHKECASCHETHSATVIKTCVQCHEVAKLPGLHAEAKHQKCESCHAPHPPEPGAGPDTCRGCHKKLSLEEHRPAPTSCSGCHLFKDASPVK